MASVIYICSINLFISKGTPLMVIIAAYGTFSHLWTNSIIILYKHTLNGVKESRRYAHQFLAKFCSPFGSQQLLPIIMIMSRTMMLLLLLLMMMVMMMMMEMMEMMKNMIMTMLNGGDDIVADVLIFATHICCISMNCKLAIRCTYGAMQYVVQIITSSDIITRYSPLKLMMVHEGHFTDLCAHRWSLAIFFFAQILIQAISSPPYYSRI